MRGWVVDRNYIFQESSLADQWLEIFRAGDYGDKGSFSNEDLDQMVANFNPSFHEPPVVIGHPVHDAPAYAWVEALKRRGNTLLGKLKQVDPKFEEMVKAGHFKKRSASLYQTTKGWMLRHIGFLGAQPPEIKGLANAVFQEGRHYLVEMSFCESQSRADAAIDRLKNRGYWLSEFDRYGIPVLFAELEHSTALDALVSFLEQTMEGSARALGSNIPSAVAYMESATMSSYAKELSLTRKVSFGEALDMVAERRGQVVSRLCTAANSHGLRVDLNSAKLSQCAQDLAWSKCMSFGEALSQVAEEHPELTFPG